MHLSVPYTSRRGGRKVDSLKSGARLFSASPTPEGLMSFSACGGAVGGLGLCALAPSPSVHILSVALYAPFPRGLPGVRSGYLRRGEEEGRGGEGIDRSKLEV